MFDYSWNGFIFSKNKQNQKKIKEKQNLLSFFSMELNDRERSWIECSRVTVWPLNVFRRFFGISSVLSRPMWGQIAPSLPKPDVAFTALLTHHQCGTHQDLTFPLSRIAAGRSQQATFVGTSNMALYRLFPSTISIEAIRLFVLLNAPELLLDWLGIRFVFSVCVGIGLSY